MNGEFGETLEDAERFQRLFVTPMINAVRTEMTSHLAPIAATQKAQAETLRQHAADIDSLKGTQKKVVVVWGLVATAATALLTTLGTWLKNKFHIS